jgi:cell wall-associated NlpC family hydrolase
MFTFEDGPITRRRALALAAALVAGLGGTLGDAEEATAGDKEGSEKRDRKTSKDKRKKDRKNKNKDKGKSKKKKQKDGGTSASGEKVVKEAKKYKGAKYKWGGESPKGFDCSGFTWFVYDKAANMEIGRTVKDQYKRGKSVGKGDWKAGDLVFFKNTFENGLSHNGIYISGGKFIHAENEKSGVVISSLDSGYYDDHYAGARRLV